MIITIQPGEKLIIRVADIDGSPLDGEFEVHMDTKEHPRALVVTETGGFKPNDIGQANAVLYRENYLPDFSERIKLPAW